MASIRVREKSDGTTTWAVLWRDPNLGKQTSLSYDNPGQAETLKRLLDANYQKLSRVEGLLVDTVDRGPLFGEVFEGYVSHLVRPNVDTVTKYRNMYAKHIEAQFGMIPVKLIDDDRITDWIIALKKSGLTPKTISNVSAPFKAALDRAVQRGHVGVNPFNSVIMPVDDRVDTVGDTLEREEYSLLFGLLKKIGQEHYETFVDTLMETGARFGEIAALGPKDVVLPTKGPATISVNKAWKGNGTTRRIGPPKNRQSRRNVTIRRSLAKEILALDATDGLLFTTKTGLPIKGGTFRNRVWQPLLETAHKEGFEKSPRVHDLRHTHVAWLIEAGVDPYTISRRLGHSSIKTTFDIYGDLLNNAEIRTSEVLDSTFDGLHTGLLSKRP